MSRWSRARIVLSVVFGCLILASVLAVWWSAPWVRRPPISHEDAEATLEEYTKIVDRMAALPGEDHAALEALFARWKDRLESSQTPLRDETACPMLPDDFGPATAPFLADARTLSEEMATIVDDGLALRQLAGPEDDILDFTPLRESMRWEGALAILDARAGDSAAAARRIERLGRISEGVVGAPVLIHVLMAAAMDGIADLAVLSAAPRLGAGKLTAIVEGRRARTRYDDAFRESVAIEAVWMSRSLPTDFSSMRMLDREADSIHDHLMSMLFATGPRRTAIRERDVYLYITRDYLSHLDEDTLSDTDPLKRLRDRGVRSVVAEMGWPNMPTLRAKLREMQKRFDAVTAFLERVAASGIGGLGASTFPYNEKYEIWTDGQSVCLK
ncbi:MAG: hypothetical protein IT350_15785 [Deltaproteobacteria bacterium]|nr:hypothetical protein [Deltaproteobacteria bacterium]